MTSNRSVALYDDTNLDECPWPVDSDGKYAQSFLEPLVRQGVKGFLDNVETRMAVLIVNGQALPVTINYAEYENAFVCSPYTQYVSYASLISEKLRSPVLRKAYASFLKLYSKMMRRGKLNKVVMVNNWLFTTNIPPKIGAQDVQAITDYLKKRFPDHAIVFRALTKSSSPDACSALDKQGYRFIASRYMYITNGADDAVFKTRIFKSDLKFIRESDYTVVEQNEFTEEEMVKLQELYSALYIEKYSTYNPKFTARFMGHLLRNGLLHFRGIRHGNDLEGFIGYFYRGNAMISSLFGYDPAKTERKGVYRYLSTLLMLEAQRNRAVFNQSAGGATYKKIRRAQGEMEYMAAYCSHLPLKRKLPWMILQGLLNTIGTRVMQNY